MLRSAQILSVVTFFVLASCSTSQVWAQGDRAREAEAQRPAAGNQISPQLAELLTNWSRASDQIKNLHGRHTRRVYDTAFTVEKISYGEVWFEAPDKGRIDIKAVEITSKMLADRQAEGAKVQRDAKGVPYKLTSDAEAKWICDGERVFDVNEEEKRAQIANLPPTLRGKDIMNSPLPFLFGMPPDKAVQRFNMKITTDYRPKYPYVIIEAKPRLPQDASNWSQAEIYLNTQTFLPGSVKLLDPGQKSSTVYSFTKVEINKKGIIDWITGNNPWKPNLRGYTINVIEQQQQQNVAGGGAGPDGVAQINDQKMEAAPVATIPNVIGKTHGEAEQILLNAGIPQNLISKQRGGPAQRAQDVFRVRDQRPKPGTPVANVLRAQEKVALAIFEKPQ